MCVTVGPSNTEGRLSIHVILPLTALSISLVMEPNVYIYYCIYIHVSIRESTLQHEVAGLHAHAENTKPQRMQEFGLR